MFAKTTLLLIPHKVFTCLGTFPLEVIRVDVKLLVDNEEIDLNEFATKILAGTIAGAVTSLRGIKKDWKEISIIVKR
jgi:hypothetical protein